LFNIGKKGSYTDAIDTLKDEISESQLFDKYMLMWKPTMLSFYASFPIDDTATSPRTEGNSDKPSSI
jgi:hypothetical protein